MESAQPEKAKRRRVAFGLRTLIVAVTLISVALAFTLVPVEHQIDYVDRIYRPGTVIDVFEYPPATRVDDPKPKFFKRLARDAKIVSYGPQIEGSIYNGSTIVKVSVFEKWKLDRFRGKYWLDENPDDLDSMPKPDY